MVLLIILNGKSILRCGAAPFRFMFVVHVLSSFDCAINLVSGIATKATIVFSKIKFTLLVQSGYDR